MPKNTPTIKYTSRNFDSIKNDLLEYAKRYYPTTFKDFSEASFGAMMVDMVAYVGDILSFYLDYQANECFLDTATEYDNIVKLAKQFGYKFNSTNISQGVLSFFLTIPANNTGAPDERYMPILKKGSQFESGAGSTFVLVDDIDFSDEDNDIVVANTNTVGNPTSYAIKAVGRVMSGRIKVSAKTVGAFEKFKKFKLGDTKISEVVSITDSEGHEYFEVEHLSQNVIYLPIRNKTADKTKVPNLVKPFVVPRRFVVEHDRESTYIQFGYGSDSELRNESVADPCNLILDVHGKTHVTDRSFDPTKLISSDKFGVAPANTTLNIVYRINESSNVNAAADAIGSVVAASFEFTNPSELNLGSMSNVESSLECTNEEPIVGDTTLPSAFELKQRIKNHYFSQNRAVTAQDYQTLVYAMPAKFGSIKKCIIIQDKDSFRRNLNLYVISEDRDGKLIQSTSSLKENIKTWLSGYKMVNDTIDILDAKIINLGIEYNVRVENNVSRYDVLTMCNRLVRDYFRSTREVGEHLFITDVYKIINSIRGVIDAIDVKIVNKVGSQYSDVYLDINSNLSSDGTKLFIPNDCIIEFKYPSTDIRGSAK
jgi:hypothetical protein